MTHMEMSRMTVGAITATYLLWNTTFAVSRAHRWIYCTNSAVPSRFYDCQLYKIVLDNRAICDIKSRGLGDPGVIFCSVEIMCLSHENDQKGKPSATCLFVKDEMRSQKKTS